MTRLSGDKPDFFPFIISFYTVVRYLLLSPCVFFCRLILGRDYVMRFGRSLTIDLSLSPIVFLAWCLHLRDKGGDVAFGVGR